MRSTPALGVAHTTASLSPSSFAQGRLGSSKLPSRDHWCTGSHARRSKPLLSIRRRVSSKASPRVTPCRLSLTAALSRAPFFLVTLIPFPQGHSHARSSKIRAGSPRLLFLVVHRRCRAIATGSLFIPPHTFSLIVFNCTAESLLELEKDVSRLVQRLLEYSLSGNLIHEGRFPKKNTRVSLVLSLVLSLVVVDARRDIACRSIFDSSGTTTVAHALRHGF